jgi:tetratricopeptide (TPR) repeat protein
MPQRISPKALLALTVLATSFGISPFATSDVPQAQTKWMPCENCRPRIRSREIPINRLDLPFVVTAVSGEWLWVDGAWVRTAEVVALGNANAYYTELLRLNSSNTWALRMRALTREAEGHLDDALRDYSEIVRLKPADADARTDRAGIQMERGDYGDALKEIEVALRLDAADPILLLLRAILRCMQSDDGESLAKAVQDCEQAIHHEPELAFAYVVRGFIRSLMKEYDKALLDYAEAIRLEPSEYLVYCEQALLWTTAEDLKYRDPKRAVDSATKACEMTHWKDAEAIRVLGIACRSAGDAESASKWTIKATRMGAHPEGSKGGLLMRSLRDEGGLHRR